MHAVCFDDIGTAHSTSANASPHRGHVTPKGADGAPLSRPGEKGCGMRMAYVKTVKPDEPEH